MDGGTSKPGGNQFLYCNSAFLLLLKFLYQFASAFFFAFFFFLLNHFFKISRIHLGSVPQRPMELQLRDTKGEICL